MIPLKDLEFAVFIPSRTPWVPLSLEVQNQTKEIERLGFHSLWFPDNLAIISPRFEVWTLLSALASRTSRIRLGPLVLPESFRYPILLARMAATLDRFSEGRLEFGIKMWWREPGYEAHRHDLYESPDTSLRVQEAIWIIRQLWTEETVTHEGRFFSIRKASCRPKPVQEPYPPITIGDSRDKLSMSLVAQFADRFNLTGSVETCHRKLDTLAKHCSRIGRDHRDIEKSLFSYIQISEDEKDLKTGMKEAYRSFQISPPFERWYEHCRRELMITGTPDECVDKIKEFMKIGIGFFILRFHQIPSMRSIRQIKDQIVDCV